MTLLATAERLNTANQLKSWYEQTVNNMNQAKTTYTSIYNQRVAMSTNPEYIAEDLVEVDNLLVKLNTLAKTLIIEETPVTE